MTIKDVYLLEICLFVSIQFVFCELIIQCQQELGSCKIIRTFYVQLKKLTPFCLHYSYGLIKYAVNCKYKKVPIFYWKVIVVVVFHWKLTSCIVCVDDHFPFLSFSPTPHFCQQIRDEGKLFLHVQKTAQQYWILFYKDHFYIHQQGETCFEIITVSCIKRS